MVEGSTPALHRRRQARSSAPKSRTPPHPTDGRRLLRSTRCGHQARCGSAAVSSHGRASGRLPALTSLAPRTRRAVAAQGVRPVEPPSPPPRRTRAFRRTRRPAAPCRERPAFSLWAAPGCFAGRARGRSADGPAGDSGRRRGSGVASPGAVNRPGRAKFLERLTTFRATPAPAREADRTRRRASAAGQAARGRSPREGRRVDTEKAPALRPGPSGSGPDAGVRVAHPARRSSRRRHWDSQSSTRRFLAGALASSSQATGAT